MDDSEPAEAPKRDREARVGDGIHRGGEDRDVEADLVGEPRLGRDPCREDVAAGRDQEDVVEGQTFLGELVLPGQSAALTRASVSAKPPDRARRKTRRDYSGFWASCCPSVVPPRAHASAMTTR